MSVEALGAAEPCPSEASSILATTVSDLRKDAKVKKLKNEMSGEDDAKGSSNQAPESSSSRTSNGEPNLRASEPTESFDEKGSEEGKVFSSTFCRKEFSTTQALVGHQNAHRQERAIAKRHQELKMGFFEHPHYPYYPYYSSLNSHPYYGSLNRSPYGIKLNSMIHKPSPCLWTSFGSRFSQQLRWSGNALMNPHLGIHRNTRGFGISELHDSSSLRFQENIGMTRNFLGISPENVAVSNRPTAARSDHVDASGLDLSLKL